MPDDEPRNWAMAEAMAQMIADMATELAAAPMPSHGRLFARLVQLCELAVDRNMPEPIKALLLEGVRALAP